VFGWGSVRRRVDRREVVLTGGGDVGSESGSGSMSKSEAGLYGSGTGSGRYGASDAGWGE